MIYWQQNQLSGIYINTPGNTQGKQNFWQTEDNIVN
jgi:hypothetical protein